MRKLLNTLFVLTPESYLALEGENILILMEEKELGRFLALGLSEEENRAILYDNFARLFLGEEN